MHSFASLEYFLILNSICVNLYITCHKNDFFLWILFYDVSNDIKKLCDITSATLVVRHDSILKEIFPPGNYIVYYKLYFLQKLLKIAIDL